MRPLSGDLREFIHLLNTNSVKFVLGHRDENQASRAPLSPSILPEAVWAIPGAGPAALERRCVFLHTHGGKKNTLLIVQ
jgi:hypothetical protein